MLSHDRIRSTAVVMFAFFTPSRGWTSSWPTQRSLCQVKSKTVHTGYYSSRDGWQDEDETPFYPHPRSYNQELLGDLTGGRPGAIVETEEQLERKEQILREMETGERKYDRKILKDYGELIEDEEAAYDIDDPDAIDQSTLGTWTIQDLNSKFDYEWDPNSGMPDPNKVELRAEGKRYIVENEKDDDGVEVGYNPMFGPSNPIDTRTVLGSMDSYMIDEKTKDDRMLTPQFEKEDIEFNFNEDVVQYRKSLDILETYVDPFLPKSIQVPRHVAKWHGYPEQTFLEPKNYTNNRFTTNPTDFDALEPYRARQLAVEMARRKNAEWLPDGVSQEWHRQQRQPYEDYQTLVGTLRRGTCDDDIVEQIQPVLQVLGSIVDLLSIEGSIFRFQYYGLMKNRFGMECWAQTMIKDCGVDCTGVVFETGFRKRDPAYDGGDSWYGPSN